MIIATTVGNLAATGISYLSSMNTITDQRAELDRMWAKAHNLNNNLASYGRKFTPNFNEPISEVLVRKVQDTIQGAKDFFYKKQSQYHHNILNDKLKMDRIGRCDSNLAKRILKKQTAVVTNSDR